MDQLMNFAWKFMLPMSLINIVAAAVWHFMRGGYDGWFVSLILVAGPYFLLGRGLMSGQKLKKRTYRFVE
jgi:NADH-quinone oxidoreductase subunit H